MSFTDEPTPPFGAWPSAIGADDVVRASVSLGTPVVSDGWVWWSELRPEERGRVQVVGRPLAGESESGEGLVELLPDGCSARTRVHEYGGQSFWVFGEVALFVNDADQRVYRIDRPRHVNRSVPREITPLDPEISYRFADLSVGPDKAGAGNNSGAGDNRWVLAVRESHRQAEVPDNEIVAFPLDGSAAPTVLVSGADFVSHPRFAPDGCRISWVQWALPDMPWDATQLWVASFDDATADERPLVSEARACAGGADISLTQPQWDADGFLWFVSDQQSGWWNVWRFAPFTGVHPDPAELVWDGSFECAAPQWVFGQSSYAVADGRLVAVVERHDGVDHLAGPAAPNLDLPAGITSIDGVVSDGVGGIVCLAAGFASEQVVLALPWDGPARVLRPSRPLKVDGPTISVPDHIAFPTGARPTGARPTAGDARSNPSGDETPVAYALYYPPSGPYAPGPTTERPPLLVLSHGGPTAAARPMLSLAVQFWTTRGFAVVDVNYRGSTGYGRRYRHALDGQWGIVDVEDCVAAARYLAEQGLVDPDRMAIKGGSAGGFTTLCALTFHDAFRAGSSLYGVADLESLAADTHKFGSRYLDRLVGPYPADRATYVERSPVHHLARLRNPVIVFQGLEDAVVPPAQAEAIVEALDRNGVTHAYLAFAGEQHGFRQAANIKRVLEAEHYFFATVFGFAPPADVEPVPIRHLERQPNG